MSVLRRVTRYSGRFPAGTARSSDGRPRQSVSAFAEPPARGLWESAVPPRFFAAERSTAVYPRMTESRHYITRLACNQANHGARGHEDRAIGGEGTHVLFSEVGVSVFEVRWRLNMRPFSREASQGVDSCRGHMFRILTIVTAGKATACCGRRSDRDAAVDYCSWARFTGARALGAAASGSVRTRPDRVCGARGAVPQGCPSARPDSRPNSGDRRQYDVCRQEA